MYGIIGHCFSYPVKFNMSCSEIFFKGLKVRKLKDRRALKKMDGM